MPKKPAAPVTPDPVVDPTDAADAADAAEDAAVAAAADLRAMVESLEATVATLTTERDNARELLTGARQHIANLTADLQAAHAQIAAQPLEETVDLGTIVVDGLVVVVGADRIDRSWRRPGDASSRFAVDFVGPSAEALATGQPRLPAEQLADGTWRMTVPDRTTAAHVTGQAKRVLATREDGTTVTSAPIGAGSMLALDATRAQGAGVATLDGEPAIAALRLPGSTVRVAGVLGVDGRVREIRIRS